MSLITFPVASIFYQVGFQHSLNVFTENIDDEAYGVAITNDAAMAQWWQGEKDLFNFQIIDQIDSDGVPFILLKRTLVNADLIVDLGITEDECIPASKGAPAITYERVDPLSLPREVELAYIDPFRAYARNTQSARHHAASVHHGKLSIQTTFVLGADQARALAFDLLYRIWDQQLSLSFNHPNLNVEPGDVLEVSGRGGTHTVLVSESIITPNYLNQIKATVLLTVKGVTGLFSSDGSTTLSGGQTDDSGLFGGEDEPIADWLFTAN